MSPHDEVRCTLSLQYSKAISAICCGQVYCNGGGVSITLYTAELTSSSYAQQADRGPCPSLRGIPFFLMLFSTCFVLVDDERGVLSPLLMARHERFLAPFFRILGRRRAGVLVNYAQTVTRKKVAGMEVASLRGLLFWLSNRTSSSFCRSPARPFFSAASNAFMVGP